MGFSLICCLQKQNERYVIDDLWFVYTYMMDICYFVKEILCVF